MRYGHEAISPPGKLHKAHVDFLEWAQQYDHGGLNMRSRALHEQWYKNYPARCFALTATDRWKLCCGKSKPAIPKNSLV
jgi:hypothetical protein